MPNDSEQVPLSDALKVYCPKHGKYVHKVPDSLCFGSVIFGGYTTSYIHKACVHFTAQTAKTVNHHDVHHSSVQFFRPIFPAPREIELYITIASANKGWTVLHAELKQGGKVCTASYVTLCDFSASSTLTVSMNWQLVPPAPPVDLEALSRDTDPGWVTYHTPWDSKGLRKPYMYVSHSLPIVQPSTHGRHTTDQWIRAYWPEPSGKPAVWTDEMIPFVLDSTVPMMAEVIDPSGGAWSRVIEAGKLQASARARGESDDDTGYIDEEVGLRNPFPWVALTLSMTTEIKKRLPKKGVRYLRLRTSSKSLVNNRVDYELILTDEHGDLVAVGSQVMVVMPISVKQDRKRVADTKL